MEKNIEWCENGLVAVEKVRKIVNETLLNSKTFPVLPIAVIILDMNMPKKNGLKALEEIMICYKGLWGPQGMKRESWITYPKVIIMSGYAP